MRVLNTTAAVLAAIRPELFDPWPYAAEYEWILKPPCEACHAAPAARYGICEACCIRADQLKGER